jgi:hypothetical protein
MDCANWNAFRPLVADFAVHQSGCLPESLSRSTSAGSL